MTSPWVLHHEDCIKAMAAMESDSVDAIVCDPPYGLEFMGKDWDSFGGKADWRESAGLTKPGIGEREIPWPSYSGDTANATCATCGGRIRGAKQCSCEKPDWRVKGVPIILGEKRLSQSRVFQEFNLKWATEALRVAKPGAYLLAFGGTRMYHRLAVAIEDAGWELRDCFSYLYGSGFPKSLDVSKAIDKAAGAEREVVGTRPVAYPDSDCWGTPNANSSGASQSVAHAPLGGVSVGGARPITAPATEAAKQWAGFGTALKPAWEPIIVARKPLIGTVAANVLKYGTGGINVDACRIEGEPRTTHADGNRQGTAPQPMDWGKPTAHAVPGASGRWPANVILGCCGNDPHDPDCAVRLLDEQSGTLTSGNGVKKRASGSANGIFNINKVEGSYFQVDSGGASRFFYTAKASRSERTHGGEVVNLHPTVKPIELMRWLVRLVTPRGGLVLDPFTGSGSTGVAAILEGFSFVGCEMEAESVNTSRARLELATLVAVGGVKNPWEDEPAEAAPAEETPAISSIEDLFGFGE